MQIYSAAQILSWKRHQLPVKRNQSTFKVRQSPNILMFSMQQMLLSMAHSALMVTVLVLLLEPAKKRSFFFALLISYIMIAYVICKKFLLVSDNDSF